MLCRLKYLTDVSETFLSNESLILSKFYVICRIWLVLIEPNFKDVKSLSLILVQVLPFGSS